MRSRWCRRLGWHLKSDNDRDNSILIGARQRAGGYKLQISGSGTDIDNVGVGRGAGNQTLISPATLEEIWWVTQPLSVGFCRTEQTSLIRD